MLCIPLQKLTNDLPQGVMVEFRLDLFKQIDFEALRTMREKISTPVIFTSRNFDEIRKVCTLKPDYLDLDYRTPRAFVEEIRKSFPAIKLLISYHNFDETPEDLEKILTVMKQLPGSLYKMACMAHSSNDALRMLSFVKERAPLLGLCMGERGELTRILGTHFGAPWTFASLSEEEKTAPGQLTLEEMEIYNLNSSQIYGLLGGSLKKRPSHRFHNGLMRELGLDSIYVKIPLDDPAELSIFFSLAKKIGIKGLSVTDPLKEHVIPFLDHIDSEATEIGAVNTIVFREGKLFGYNTDGKGALDAIEKRMQVSGKKITIIGAGGAAKALIYEALKRGGRVTVLNRTKEKALKLARKWNIQVGELSDLKECDILINTTPFTPPHIPSSLSMDISVMSSPTPSIIDGREMWLNQALRQYQIWRPDLSPSTIKETLSKIIFNDRV